jgi:hypothetical protein
VPAGARAGDAEQAFAARCWCQRSGSRLPAGPSGPSRSEPPLWRRFLAEVTGGDTELQAYLQRLVGYSLIGQVIEHVLVFLYGTGGNGKGVFRGTPCTPVSNLLWMARQKTVAPLSTSWRTTLGVAPREHPITVGYAHGHNALAPEAAQKDVLVNGFQ